MRIINTAEFVSEEDLAGLSPNEREYMYNGLDCCVTLELLETLLAELDEANRATYQIELDLRGPILEMSLRGIKIDLRQRDKVLDEKIILRERLHKNLNRILFEAFDLNINYRSTQALLNLFYNVLGLKPIKKRNAKGVMAPTVNREALEKLQFNYYAGPLCRFILLLRDLDKQISFLKTGLDADQRIRATFNIAGTNTGRLSSSISEFGTGTNLQNVDRSLRTIFIPDRGMKFINVDLEQGDSRNMGAMMYALFYESHGAAFAGSYLDACESADLHTTVARMCWTELEWGDDPKNWRKVADQHFYRQDSYRQTAKRLGHGTNYLGQPFQMAMHSKMPVKIIEAFQASYFAAFPVIKVYHDWIAEQLRSTSTLTTLHKRRRFFFGRSTEKSVRNEATAYPSQSMTAEAVNLAMIRIFRAKLPAQFLCQVHDSLLFQVREELVDEIVPQILELGKIKLLLPGDREFFVPNEAKVGWNWGDFDKSDPLANPHGLVTWKGPGSDTRHRPFKKKLSLRKLLA